MIELVARSIAEACRKDLYEASDSPGLEPGDFYLNGTVRDVGLYVFDGEHADGPNVRADTLVCRFVRTRRSLFHLELLADFLRVVEIVRPTDIGLRVLYRNECTYVRSVQVEDVPGVVSLVVAAVGYGLVRRKKVTG